MMQTIKNCNEIHVGKTYPICDLRTAESIEQLCDYVDAGHPIASLTGYPARLLRRVDKNRWHYDWLDSFQTSVPYWSAVVANGDADLLAVVKLAPLAYKDGRPLHVGDEIIVRILGERWDCMTMGLELLQELETMQWRFSDEVTE